jgi:hypothetical protein
MPANGTTPILTVENLQQMRREALEKLIHSPQRCKARLERFISASADLAGALYVIEAKEQLDQATTQPTLPGIGGR